LEILTFVTSCVNEVKRTVKEDICQMFSYVIISKLNHRMHNSVPKYVPWNIKQIHKCRKMSKPCNRAQILTVKYSTQGQRNLPLSLSVLPRVFLVSREGQENTDQSHKAFKEKLPPPRRSMYYITRFLIAEVELIASA
jgi:hypothetical protein